MYNSHCQTQNCWGITKDSVSMITKDNFLFSLLLAASLPHSGNNENGPRSLLAISRTHALELMTYGLCHSSLN